METLFVLVAAFAQETIWIQDLISALKGVSDAQVVFTFQSMPFCLMQSGVDASCQPLHVLAACLSNYCELCLPAAMHASPAQGQS